MTEIAGIEKDSYMKESGDTSWEENTKEVFSGIYKEDFHLLENLSLAKLNEYHHQRSSLYPFEIRVLNKNMMYDWIKVNAKIMNNGERALLITTQITNENHMLQKVVDLYVLNNLDYLILININYNSYVMYDGNPNSTIPPESGIDYEGDVKIYNKKFVVPEELEAANQNMMLSNVLGNLEINDVYEFTAGFFDLQKCYHRSRLQFSYYDKSAGLIVLTRTDITQIYLEEGEKERKLAKALREANLDPLTDIYNSKAVYELISKALLHQYRAQAVLFFIDLDNFKLVNDTFGHQIGNEVLCHVTKKLKSLASKDGIAGRIGGDEFVLFLPIVSLDYVKGYAREICNSLQDFSLLKAGDLASTCSVGSAVYPKDGTTYKQLLSKSDQALYDAKHLGKNCFSLYSHIE